MTTNCYVQTSAACMFRGRCTLSRVDIDMKDVLGDGLLLPGWGIAYIPAIIISFCTCSSGNVPHQTYLTRCLRVSDRYCWSDILHLYCRHTTVFSNMFSGRKLKMKDKSRRADVLILRVNVLIIFLRGGWLDSMTWSLSNRNIDQRKRQSRFEKVLKTDIWHCKSQMIQSY